MYPLVFFLVAMPLEWWLWKDAPFMQLGWQVVFGLSIVVAAVPWIGSVAHPADSAALRRHPARFAFVLPALAFHLAIFALYGPYWRSGAGDGSVTIHRLVIALREPAQMSTLLVEVVARTGDDPSEVLRDIALLRRLGADVNAPAPDGRYPLDAAARPEALAALLDSGARRHSDQVSAQLRRLVDADLLTWRRWDACWRWAWIRIWSNRQSLLVSPRCSGPLAGTCGLSTNCWRLVPGSTPEPIATAAPRWITRTTVAALQFWSASLSTKVRHRRLRLRRRKAQANAEPQPRGCRTKDPPCIHNTAGPADVGTDAHRLEPKPLRTAPTCTFLFLLHAASLVFCYFFHS